MYYYAVSNNKYVCMLLLAIFAHTCVLITPALYRTLFLRRRASSSYHNVLPHRVLLLLVVVLYSTAGSVLSCAMFESMSHFTVPPCYQYPSYRAIGCKSAFRHHPHVTFFMIHTPPTHMYTHPSFLEYLGEIGNVSAPCRLSNRATFFRAPFFTPRPSECSHLRFHTFHLSLAHPPAPPAVVASSCSKSLTTVTDSSSI